MNLRISDIEYHLASQTESLRDLKDCNPDWQIESLYEKVGIETRHIATEKETALSLGVEAGKKLISHRDPRSIDGLIYVTQSPESLIPSSACILHEQLGLRSDCLALDLNQGCSGFVYALAAASSLMGCGNIENCLIVCAETYTKYISKHDRTCRPIFSDGASAVLLAKDGSGHIGPFYFYTRGSGAENLTLRFNHQASDVTGPLLFMDGRKVFMFTVEEVPKAVQVLLERANLTMSDIDLFVFHQASKVVMDSLQRLLGIKDERMLRNYQDVGNTVSSTIPIALKQAMREGRLKEGMVILVMGFGVGLSLAGGIIRT